MERTELLTNLIKDHIAHNRFMDVDTFRDMFTVGLPGKLALLAVSRDGQKILPVFDTHVLPTTDVVNYRTIKECLGPDWTPILNAHVWHHSGLLPQTLLAIDGIVDERVLTRIFNNHLPTDRNWVGVVHAFNFGDFDLTTLPALALFTVDREGARRLRVPNDKLDGKVHGIHMDPQGHVRVIDHETGRTLMARLEIGRVELTWNVIPLNV